MSLPPRPSEVISFSVLMPWKPATTQTLPSARRLATRSPLTSRILALPCAVSVMMPAWLPVKLFASMPRSASAMQSSAMLMRSPVVISMSISRPGWVLETSLASLIRLSVDLPIALGDDDDVVAVPLGEGDVLGDSTNAVGVGDGRTAVLLHNQGHGCRRLSTQVTVDDCWISSLGAARVLLTSLPRRGAVSASPCSPSRARWRTPAFGSLGPFLAVIARGNGTTLAGIGVAVAISELSGLLSPLNGEIVERLHRRTAMVVGLVGVAVGDHAWQPAACTLRCSRSPWSLIVAEQDDVRPRPRRMDSPTACRTRNAVESWGSPRSRGRSGCWSASRMMGLVTAATNWRVGYGLGAAAVLCMAGVHRRANPTRLGRSHRARSRPLASPIDGARGRGADAGMFCLMAASQVLFVTFGSWLDDAFDFTPAMLSVVAFGLGFGELICLAHVGARTPTRGARSAAPLPARR